MASSERDGRKTDRPRTVTMARDEMRFQRMRVREELINNGSVSLQTKQTLAERIIEFLDELRENEETIENTHSVPDLEDTIASEVEDLSWQTTTISKQVNRSHSPRDDHEVTAVVTLPASKLVEASLQLDKISNKLGLGTPVRHNDGLSEGMS